MVSRQNFHENLTRDQTVAGPTDRSFGLTVGGAFVVLAAVLWWGDSGLWPWLAAVGGVLIAGGIIAPRRLAPLNRLWMRFGLLLHRIVNPLIMGFLFFLTITPIGLILRLSGKDLLRLRLDPQAPSYWIERRPPGPKPETMRQQY